MATQLNRENIGIVKNPVFRTYAENYLDVYDDFVSQVDQFGLPFAPTREKELQEERNLLRSYQVTERNNGASLVEGTICGACDACRTGIDSYTGIISLMCHRNCFFCFGVIPI